MSHKRHKFMEVTHGLWFFRANCTCGWISKRRWKPEKAEADLMTHQHDEHEKSYGG